MPVAVASFTLAWALTVIVETPIWATLLRWVEGVELRRGAVVGALVTGISHPLLWWVLQPGLSAATGSDLVGVLLAELVVWLGEAFGARVLIRARLNVLLAISALANLSSLLVGVLWTMIV